MKRGDGFFEAVAPDKPHRVKRPAVRIAAQAVDRHDSRVLEAAGDLGLDQKAPAARGVVGMPVEDLLERDLAVQLGVERDEDAPRPPLACGRSTRNRSPPDDDVPMAKLEECSRFHRSTRALASASMPVVANGPG